MIVTRTIDGNSGTVGDDEGEEVCVGASVDEEIGVGESEGVGVDEGRGMGVGVGVEQMWDQT